MKPSSNMHRPTPPFGFITDRLRGSYSTKRKNSNYLIEKNKFATKMWQMYGKFEAKEIERDFAGFPDRFYGTS